MIEQTMDFFGPTPLAAVLPCLVFGTLTVPLCWWVARDWFGPPAGIAAAALAALSDFQILYSRTALTDPVLCFWFLLAVYCSWRALVRRRMREAIVAGIAVGAAWSTKYNGWLPLAVAISGFVAWAFFQRLDRHEWTSHLSVLAVIALVAGICWSPVLISLQSEGGYSAVAKNHAGYFVGFHGWWHSFKQQTAMQRYFNGWLSCASIGLAWLLPAIAGWPAARGYKKTADITTNVAPTASARTISSSLSDAAGLRSTVIFFGLTTVNAAVGVISAIVLGASVELALVALGLAPCLYRWHKSRTTDCTSPARNLAGWLVAAWFVGLFVSTPTYKAYSRLALPWLVSAWMAVSAVIGCWIVRFHPEKSPNSCVPGGRWLGIWPIAARLAQGLAVLAFAAAIGWKWSVAAEIPAWQNRAVRAQVIAQALHDLAREGAVAPGSNSPIFFVYGEPAIFFHLALHGFDAQPLGDLRALEEAQFRASRRPAFLWTYQTPKNHKGLKPVEFCHDTPSDLVLLDTYAPADLNAGKGRPIEQLGVYRV